MSTTVSLGANKYGKAENRVVRITRDTARHEIEDLNVTSQLRGAKLIDSYLVGDNSLVVATDTQKKNLQGFIAQIQKAAETNDAPGFIRSSKDMYSELILAANNEYFQTLDLFHGLSRRFWFAHQRGPDDLRDVVNAHTARIKAIVHGDADAAKNATDKLMDHLETFARNTINRY